MQTIKQQKPSDKSWTDEAGNLIPYNRTTPVERLMEKEAAKMARKAVKLNADLSQFKREIRDTSEQVYASFLNENEGRKPSKGNYTWYNFDRSVKIEISINERIEFDEMTINLCKETLMDFIESNITGSDEFIKSLILAAFETSKGKLDVKKVLSLKTHQSRIKDKRYHEAMKLLDKAIRRPDSRTYYRIWLRNDKGDYNNIDLNISSL